MEMENIPLATLLHPLDQFESAVENAHDDHYVFVSEGRIVASPSLDEKQDHQQTREIFKNALLEKYPSQQNFVDQLFNANNKEPLNAARIKQIQLQVEQAALAATPITTIEKIEDTIKETPLTPTRAFGIPITPEQLKRITTTAALAQGSIGLLKGGVALAALGTTGALLAVPIGILIINHFASSSNASSATTSASQENIPPPTSSASSTAHFNGHRIEIIDHASDRAEEYKKRAFDALGVGFAAQLEGQFLHALTASHAAVAASSPMTLIIAGAWATGFASGIVSFRRISPTASQQESAPDQKT